MRPRVWWCLLFGIGLSVTTSRLARATSSLPASGRLLFTKLTNGTWQVWLMDIGSGQMQQVSYTAGDKRYPVWRSAQEVAYCTTNQTCFSQRLGDERAEPVLKEAWPVRDIAWSPDGTRLAFSRFRTDLADSANLWIADADGTQQRLLTHEPGIQQHAAWSPDGRLIAYAAGQGPHSYELFLVDLNGGAPQQLTHGRHEAFLPSWSPDGRWIAFSSNAGGDYDIWLIGADGTGLTLLTRSAGLDSAPAWTPDGNAIIFATNRRGRLELWTMQSDGSQPQLFQGGTEGFSDPTWWQGRP